MKRHEFENAARLFRAGRLSLTDFTESVFSESDPVAPEIKSEPATDLRLPLPDLRAHKGDCGRVLVIAGSRNMPGAAALAGMAALRAGAGLVTLAVPASIQAVVAGFSPCLMTRPLPEQAGQIAADAWSELAPLIDQADVIAVGPGLGTSSAAAQLVTRLYQRVKQKTVFDADGLNGLAQSNVTWQEHAGPRIVTPHPGEFQRICHAWRRASRELAPNDDLDFADRKTLAHWAQRFAEQHQVTVALKGHQTILTEGSDVHLNPTGNAGMATAGSGDVLTGIIAALWARSDNSLQTARLACWLHGRAGDLAVTDRTIPAMIATDLIEYLPAAIAEVLTPAKMA